jgi:Zn-dependent peptidase ImmA (M78 family)
VGDDRGREQRAAGIARRLQATREARREKSLHPKLQSWREALRIIKLEARRVGVHVPPLDIERLTSALNVNEVRILPLAMRGRLMALRGRFIIEINESLDAFHRNLTIAHECAHLLIDVDRVGSCVSSASRLAQGSFPEIEDLCDRGAEELVLPADWLRSKADPLDPSLNTAISLAREARVPVSFVCRRCIDLGIWQGRLYWYRRHSRNDDYECVATYPNPETFPILDLRLIEASALDEVSQKMVPTRQSLPLRPDASYVVDIVRVANDTVLLWHGF